MGGVATNRIDGGDESRAHTGGASQGDVVGEVAADITDGGDKPRAHACGASQDVPANDGFQEEVPAPVREPWAATYDWFGDESHTPRSAVDAVRN